MNRKSTSPAVLWFLAKYGFSSPELGMRRLAQRLAERYGNSRPPFDPSRLASERRVNQIVVEPMAREAVLLPTSDGFKIKIDSRLPRVRRRFALAHELGHTYFFNIDEPKPIRPYQRLRADHVEEKLCDVFAEEILMPEPRFSAHLQKLGEASLDALFQLTRTYDVSARCAAIRIANLQLWKVAIVAWQLRSITGKDGKTHDEEMRVSWAAAPKGYFIPIGDSVEPNSAVYASYDSGEPIIADEKLFLGSIRGIHRIECQRLNTEESPTVISVIHLVPLSR